MSTKYKAPDINMAYFITVTVVGWVDVFTRLSQKMVIIDSLKYCQAQKELSIFAYCLMSNHLHILCRADGKSSLPEIMRDFKKFTSKKIIETIKDSPESRREWMLDYFQKSCQHLSRGQKYKVWQDGYHAEEVYLINGSNRKSITFTKIQSKKRSFCKLKITILAVREIMLM
nr:transposase [Kaistella palustris]